MYTSYIAVIDSPYHSRASKYKSSSSSIPCRELYHSLQYIAIVRLGDSEARPVPVPRTIYVLLGRDTHRAQQSARAVPLLVRHCKWVGAHLSMPCIALVLGLLLAVASGSELPLHLPPPSPATPQHNFEPNFRPDANIYMESIRQHVFNRDGFSKVAPPLSNRTETGSPYTASGTDVFLQIRVRNMQHEPSSQFP